MTLPKLGIETKDRSARGSEGGMRCYLAHPISDYGGSARQRAALDWIKAAGWIPVNPDSPEHERGYKQLGMEYFFEVVSRCGALAFLRFPDGTIGKGVGGEIERALFLGLPVYDISDPHFDHIPITSMDDLTVLSVEQTRAKLRSLRPRILAWFSCGDASAVACRLALNKYRSAHEVIVARICIKGEHDDNERFAADWSRWTDWPITELRNQKYSSPQEVWMDRRYIAGIAGAPCTTELKKMVRKAFQRPDDLHIWGYTIEEQKRAQTFRDNNFELFSEFPLIDAKLNKSDCHALVRAAGIELPIMYRLGYDNNNCIGCPKGGAGYWNMIRRDFPAKFDWMATFSRGLGCRLVKQDGERIFLDELRATTGRQKDEVTIECSPHCGDVLDQFEAA